MKKDNTKAVKEWFRQADYDYEAANGMYKSGHYLYPVFMCHLSIEKALKALFLKKPDTYPTKTHNLAYLVDKMELTLREDDRRFLLQLNNTSLPTRYPEDLHKMMKIYTEEKAKDFLADTKTLLWIKEQ